MNSDTDWLHDIILVNESDDYNQIGDLSIFRSLGDTCRKLEYWYIEEVTFFALNANGYPIEFWVEDGLPVAKIQRNAIPDKSTVQKWLRESAEHFLSVRRHKASKNKLLLGDNEATGILPTTIEGLLAYNSYTK